MHTITSKILVWAAVLLNVYISHYLNEYFISVHRNIYSYWKPMAAEDRYMQNLIYKVQVPEQHKVHRSLGHIIELIEVALTHWAQMI